MFNRSLLRILPALLVALCGINVLAQTSTTGKVVGTVTDASGAVVPKADVQLENPATGAVQSMITDDAGGFVFPSVAPGIYKITVKMQGFRTATVVNLAVQVNGSLNVPVSLEVGGDKEIVEVTATAAAQ